MRSEEERAADAKDAQDLKNNVLLQRLLSAMDKVCYNLIKQTSYDDTVKLQQLKVTAEVNEKFKRLIDQTISDARIVEEKTIKHLWDFKE